MTAQQMGTSSAAPDVTPYEDSEVGYRWHSEPEMFHSLSPGSLHAEGDRPAQVLSSCSCSTTGCLKRYCVCFQAGRVCSERCRCAGCLNHENSEEACEKRAIAIQHVVNKKPFAFTRKASTNTVHARCSCNRSGCRKRYCVCFQAGVKCTELCKCTECGNSDAHTECALAAAMLTSVAGAPEPASLDIDDAEGIQVRLLAIKSNQVRRPDHHVFVASAHALRISLSLAQMWPPQTSANGIESESVPHALQTLSSCGAGHAFSSDAVGAHSLWGAVDLMSGSRLDMPNAD